MYVFVVENLREKAMHKHTAIQKVWSLCSSCIYTKLQ